MFNRASRQSSAIEAHCIQCLRGHRKRDGLLAHHFVETRSCVFDLDPLGVCGSTPLPQLEAVDLFERLHYQRNLLSIELFAIRLLVCAFIKVRPDEV
ncbi:Uncharacterised protein [Burkholderia pseudomallei]|nr:Uncharacterised protein [Burkholderia pseudomallei]VBQ49557.1 Uncharacterised protein [Burkholderia pseudomallei]